jgi:hypothetical protein
LPPSLATSGLTDVPNRRFDTVVMGLATYEPTLKAGIASPCSHLEQYVLSSALRKDPGPIDDLSACVPQWPHGEP